MSEEAIRVALVTGAAQGIGCAIALRLAEDGLDVAINDIASKHELLEEVAKSIRAKGRKALVVTADCSIEREVQHMTDETVKQLGGLHVMIANAGIGGIGSLLDAPIEQWARIWSINIRGVFLCYRSAAVQMIKQGQGGRIIGASSVCGKTGFANLGAYCTSKFAVRGLTQSAAAELGKHGITVNAYAPGIIDTEMTSGPGTGNERAKQALEALHAKIGQPEDIASLVSHLSKPESHFITGQSGQSITLDGGHYYFD